MRYVISGLNGELKTLQNIIKRIQAQDKDAIFILLGNQFRINFSWEMLNWLMNNITPNGRFQAVLNKEGHVILDWYYNKFLAWKSGEILEYPNVTKEVSSILYYASSLNEKELKNIIDYYMSLPVCKYLQQHRDDIQHDYYVVESWIDSTLIKLLQSSLHSRSDLKCMKEYCLFYPGDGSDYTDTGRYYVVRANYDGRCYSRRNTIALSTETVCCYCIDTEKFIEEEVCISV